MTPHAELICRFLELPARFNARAEQLSRWLGPVSYRAVLRSPRGPSIHDEDRRLGLHFELVATCEPPGPSGSVDELAVRFALLDGVLAVSWWDGGEDRDAWHGRRLDAALVDELIAALERFCEGHLPQEESLAID